MAAEEKYTICVDHSEIRPVIDELNALYEIDPDAINEFLLSNNDEELFMLDRYRSSAERTDKLFTTLKPTERLLDFLAALRTRHLKRDLAQIW